MFDVKPVSCDLINSGLKDRFLFKENVDIAYYYFTESISIQYSHEGVCFWWQRWNWEWYDEMIT